MAVSEESKSSMSPERAEDAEEAADVVEEPEAPESPEEADEPDQGKSDKKADVPKKRNGLFTKRIRRRKNPLRSGNPAKVAAERERMRSSRAAAQPPPTTTQYLNNSLHFSLFVSHFSLPLSFRA